MGKMTNPVVTKMAPDGKVVHIRFIDGKNYKLQHPGNRTYLQWQEEYITLTGISQEKFLDLAFEHCVIPEGHAGKPTIDSVNPSELGVWGKLLRRFLEGDLNSLVAGPEEGTAKKGDTGSSGKEGEK